MKVSLQCTFIRRRDRPARLLANNQSGLQRSPSPHPLVDHSRDIKLLPQMPIDGRVTSRL